MIARERSGVAAVALGIWGCVSALILLSLAVAVAHGLRTTPRVISTDAFSSTPLSLMAVGLTWGLLGVLLWLIHRRLIDRDNVLVALGLFGITFLYINVFRERTIYGDIQDYAEAAMRLSRGEPLNTSYLYTPFWATVLEPLARFGPKAIFGVCWLLNMLSIPVFYLLLHATLKAYGFGANVAGLLCFSFMVVNVPLLRTLGYVQVNLHVTNLILASLVSFPRTRAVSAVTLALAAQIKMSPLALALPYLLRRDYKWLGVFVLTVLATAGLTVAWHGLAPFQEFLFNVRRMREENGLQFRETSFDSFFAAVASFGLLSEGAARAMTVLSKVCLTAALFVIGARGVRHKLFYSHDDERRLLYNATPFLLVWMTMVSPLVWEHHPVFLALPFLLIVRRLETAAEWTWYGAAYFLEFVVPTFDFFPWSYGRLLAPLIWVGLAWSALRRPEASVAFTGVERKLAVLLGARSDAGGRAPLPS